MKIGQFTTRLVACATLALAGAVTAQAQNAISYVSVAGNDANNCTASAHCRTFTRALSVTNSGGEVIAVDSGGYGPATISKPVTLTAIGIDASITAASGGDALTINTSGNVTIVGLSLHGAAVGNDGILVENVGFLRVYNLTAHNFVNDGIQFASAGALAVYNSSFTDNGHDGLLLEHAASRAYVNGSTFDNNAFAGADSSKGKMTVVDSSAHYNNRAFFADGGTLTLTNDRAIFNEVGLVASGTTGVNGAGHLYFANCLVSDNATSYDVGAGGTLAGSTPGTTLIAPGQTKVGTLTAPIALQ
jgi:parallel beta helix pectate lyase-like protein